MWIFYRCHEINTFYYRTWHLAFQNSLRKRNWSFALGIARKNGGWRGLGSSDTTSPSPQLWNIVPRNEYRRMTAVSCARLVWNRASCNVYRCTQSLAREGLGENNIGQNGIMAQSQAIGWSIKIRPFAAGLVLRAQYTLAAPLSQAMNSMEFSKRFLFDDNWSHQIVQTNLRRPWPAVERQWQRLFCAAYRDRCTNLIGYAYIAEVEYSQPLLFLRRVGCAATSCWTIRIQRNT